MTNPVIGMLLFPGVEELDFVGPYEVFTMSREMHGFRGAPDTGPVVHLIAETKGLLTCAKGMRVDIDHDLASAPDLDVLLVPGGLATREELRNERLTGWLADRAPRAKWVTSVCTGSMLLSAAGLMDGKRITTHWVAFDEFPKYGLAGELVRNVRYVRDGNLVTSAGVSAGIDMALWLVGQLYSPEHAREVQHGMAYDPAPPYAAAV